MTNDALFTRARQLATDAASRDHLHRLVQAENRDGAVSPAELDGIVHRVWRYRESGKLYSAARPGFGVAHDEVDALLPRHYRAYALLGYLRRQHEGRRDSFALANKLGETFGWSPGEWRTALAALVEHGLLLVTDPGGRGPGDVRRVRLGSFQAPKNEQGGV